MTCSDGVQVFATEGTTCMVKVRVYDISTGDEEVWITSIISQNRGACFSINAEFIDRVLHYKVTRFTFLLTD